MKSRRGNLYVFLEIESEGNILPKTKVLPISWDNSWKYSSVVGSDQPTPPNARRGILVHKLGFPILQLSVQILDLKTQFMN